MAGTIDYSTPGTNPQRERRTHRTVLDQHGREFSCVVDRENGQPIGEMRPLETNGYTLAPWYPSQPYAKFPADGGYRFTWDYQRLGDELGGMVSAYYDFATKTAIENNLPVPEIGGVVERRVQALCGIPPFSPAISMACEMGDEWLLGKVGAVPTEGLAEIVKQNLQQFGNGNQALSAIRALLEKAMGKAIDTRVTVAEAAPSAPQVEDAVPTVYQEYVAWARKQGYTLKEIGPLWQEHKANLAGSLASV